MKGSSKNKKQVMILSALIIVTAFVAYSTFFNPEEDEVYVAPHSQANQVNNAVANTNASTAQNIGYEKPKVKEFNADITSLINELVYSSPNQREGLLSLATKESARLAELAAAVTQQQAIAVKAEYEKEKTQYELDRLRKQKSREEEEEARRDNSSRSIVSQQQNLPAAQIDYNQLVGSPSKRTESVTQVMEVVAPPKAVKKIDWDASQFEVRGVVSVEEGLMAMVFYRAVRQNLVKGSRMQNGEIIVKDITFGEIILDVGGEQKIVYFNM